jgi:serine/alanine adding enzyme
MIQVKVADMAPAGWDEYVRAHPQASAYHLADAVGIGRRVFGLRTCFLSAHAADGRLVGVLPLVEQSGVLGGRTLVSLPFFSYGGILCDENSASVALGQAAAQLARERRAKHLELRQAHESPELSWSTRLDKISMLLQLPSTVEELSRKLGSKLRSQIKRADRESPEVRVGGRELLGDFYPVFCSVMRDLGTPVYPRSMFEAVIDALQSHVSLVVVYMQGTPVAGAFLVQWRNGMEIPWAASLGRVRASSINMRLYWEALQLAIARGCQVFDFGRCTQDSNTYRFKHQWGAQPLQLYWHCPPGQAAEQGSKTRGQLELAVKAWSKLPLPVANWLGPHVTARLPW